MQPLFNSSFGVKLSSTQVAAHVVRYMKEEPGRRYKITIGTDSERLANGHADFVTAIVVHRIGNGGRYFWRRFTEGRFHTLRDRIIREVLLSLEVGKETLEELKTLSTSDERGRDLQWDFEIHVDVGENGPTKAIIQEVVGMVRAYNFEPITKPASYAASSVADRHV